jgi:hypothetical protein
MHLKWLSTLHIVQNELIEQVMVCHCIISVEKRLVAFFLCRQTHPIRGLSTFKMRTRVLLSKYLLCFLWREKLLVEASVNMLRVSTSVCRRVNVVDYSSIKIDIVVDICNLGDGLLIHIGGVQVLITGLLRRKLAVLMLRHIGLVRVIRHSENKVFALL